MPTSAHALLSVLEASGVDRVFLVPGESYLGILDGLHEHPGIDVVTCRHEAGAGFMACADGRLTRRPAVVITSRGPGASNAAIALHTAQQDAIPLLLVVGQVPRRHLRMDAFQEIDYQRMYGAVAKWVVEVTVPGRLAEAAFKAVRVATSGTPGPVVLVIPEDVQQQEAEAPRWAVPRHVPTVPDAQGCERILGLLAGARRPLMIAGGMLDQPGGREALLALAEAWHVPVAVPFRRHDLFPNRHALYAGDLGLANPPEQIDAFRDSDLILALGTRLGDVTTQGYAFPELPRPSQTLVHCYPDPAVVGAHFAADIGVVCDPVALARLLAQNRPAAPDADRRAWALRLRGMFEEMAQWPPAPASQALQFAEVIQAVERHAPQDMVLCLDAGTFAAPAYRSFAFTPPQRLMAPLSGAMGYGVPAALATQLRIPGRKVVCMVGDGGFMMTGNELILAAERKLPVLVILANNGCYGSIRLHQKREYLGREPIGTGLHNPDFERVVAGFGLRSDRVEHREQIEPIIRDAMADSAPRFVEVVTAPV